MIDVYIVSAFCKEGLGGNKAGVVLYEDKLTQENKKEIAKKLGYAETAFITDSKVADFKIEYFTPAEEVPLCGHATIASFGVLNYLNKLNKNSYTIETKSGILEVNIEDDLIFMEQNVPAFYEKIEYQELMDCFDIDCIKVDSPIRIVSTGLRDILVPIKNIEILNKLNPNFDYITNISRKYDVVGMHLYACENNSIICRNFAPLYDVDEEAATGTSNCALAGLLFMRCGLKKFEYVFEQGYSLNSPSIIKVRIYSTNGESIEKIYVGGDSKFIEKRKINIYEV